MDLSRTTASVPLTRIAGSARQSTTDMVVLERTVTIYLNGSALTRLVCSPVQLAELAAGFLYVEGILRERADLGKIVVKEDDGSIWVETAGPVEETFLARKAFAICGGGAAGGSASGLREIRPVNAALTVTAAEVLNLSNRLEEVPVLFTSTGGAHVAALARPGEMLLLYEDIGRHNAVDKLIGRCFLDGIPAGDKLLIFSGRVFSEILIKAAKLGVPIIVSRGAPTDLALALAAELGVTVIGFARGERMNVYTHRERIASCQQEVSD
ncbi:MAG: formate dehydrogenase accessory sulfurtransferase FdhD [Firmicutes bacterium]|nr:formate dehydrogenase accessory sulfurtransferase FdhD [Bacillota bacterium]